MLQVLHRLQFSLKSWQTLCYVFTLMSCLKVKPNFFSILLFVFVLSLSPDLSISYVICMSLVSTRMSALCHSYVLVCQPYVTLMYSYGIRMSLVCGFTMNPIRLVPLSTLKMFRIDLFLNFAIAMT